jgi:tetratricopeptide (TPR) repeat protein
MDHRSRNLWNHRVWMVAVACLCLAASPFDWVRQGNAAYERGEFQQALQCYLKAEALAQDPGLVAFNMATAHYGLDHFAEAEQCYRRALEDAEGARRVRALYGLGNALTQQGSTLHGRAAIQKLLAAKKAYQACLDGEPSADELTRSTCAATFADARFNLAIADRLLKQKQAETPNETPGSEEDPGSNPTVRSKPNRGSPTGNGEPDSKKPGAPDKKGPMQPGAGPEKPQPSDQPPPPGKGNLPLLLDDRDAPPMDAKSAREHLQAELDRIRKQRAEHTTAPPGSSSRVKDW